MGQISRALGMGAQFTYKDKEYTISPWTYRILGEFELYMQDEAVRNLKRLRSALSDDEYKDLVHRTKKDLDSGLYTFGNDFVAKCLQSPKHFKRLCLLCMRVKHPELDETFIEEIFNEDPELLITKMDEANVDPTKPKSN